MSSREDDTETTIHLFVRNTSLPSELQQALSAAEIQRHEQDGEEVSVEYDGNGCLLLPASEYEELRDSIAVPALLVLEEDDELRDSHEGELVEYVASATLENRPELVRHRVEAFAGATESTREQDVLKKLANYRQLFDAAPDTVLIHDKNGTIIGANQTAVERLGYPRTELLSMTVSDIEVGMDHEEMLQTWNSTSSEEPITVEGRHRHADGTEHPVEAWVTRAEIDGEAVFIGIARDITERKQYEKTLEEQRDNLETLNQVVRHDIRNDLQLVDLYAELLTDHVDDEGKDHLDKLQDAVRNAVDLTTTARQLAQVMLKEELNRETVRLDTVLIEQVEEIQETYQSASITLENIPPIDIAGNEMLASVFRNLLKNAIQHNDKQTPRVAVFATEHEDSADIYVADNGPGVPDRQKSDIFGRGEKGLESDGTGIGLYLVQSLVDNVGGEVWVEDRDPSMPPETRDESDDGEGAVFVVELPRASG